jgi:hypothetical protein
MTREREAQRWFASPNMGNALLHRYWFQTKEHLGFGVTAYSVEDAKALVDDAARYIGWSAETVKIIEDVDVRDLDQNHVVPNMGPPNFRGVWFPNLNLS